MIAQNTMSSDVIAGGNYYAEGDYAQTDVRRGVTYSRSGTRLCCLTSDFLIGFRRAVIDETGPAADEVFKTCGRKWGGFAASRFDTEMSEFYGQPLRSLTLAKFQTCLTEMFCQQGWGKVMLDLSKHDQGLILLKVHDPIFAELSGPSETPVESLMAGVLAGFFSAIFEQDLDCMQTTCKAVGDASSQFIVGLTSRLAGIPAWLEAGQSHDAIVAELANVRV